MNITIASFKRGVSASYTQVVITKNGKYSIGVFGLDGGLWWMYDFEFDDAEFSIDLARTLADEFKDGYGYAKDELNKDVD